MLPLADGPLFLVLTYAGVAVFAATGALVAASQKHDVITFVFFAAITGIGGGTLRDLLLDVPVFWILDPNYLTVSAVVGALIWIVGFHRWPLRALLWLDAIGMAAFTVLGCAKAVALGISAPVAIVMGVITATAGGIIRDITAGVPSILLSREIYITAALLGAAVFVLCDRFVSRELASGLGFVAALALRAAALAFGWSLPGFFGGLGSRRG